MGGPDGDDAVCTREADVATYAFRCASCGDFDGAFPMSDVPPDAPCPACGDPARRVFTAPRLSRGSSAAMRTIDAAARTASEPGVVQSLPRGRPARITRDPRHATLPRP